MHHRLTRRLFLASSLFSAAGCNAIASLDAAAVPLDTFDLTPVTVGGRGGQSRNALLVVAPETPAAIATDRILIRPAPQSVTYLPDARWVDDLPLMLQSLLIRSLSASGRLAYVGAADAGPVPDMVLLSRVDQFDVLVAEGAYVAQIALELTVLRDRDQQIMGSRSFAGKRVLADDSTPVIIAGFQALADTVLPDALAWVAGQASRG